jgi:hypothetical protein
MLGVALVSSTALAQQATTLRQQLVGTWENLSLGNPNGDAAKILSTNPKGYLILAGSGKYVFMLSNPNRPKDAGTAGMAASFGTWSVDEGTKTLTRHVEGSTVANTEGTDVKSTIVINGDEMRATGIPNGITNISRRVRQAQ